MSLLNSVEKRNKRNKQYHKKHKYSLYSSTPPSRHASGNGNGKSNGGRNISGSAITSASTRRVLSSSKARLSPYSKSNITYMTPSKSIVKSKFKFNTPGSISSKRSLASVMNTNIKTKSKIKIRKDTVEAIKLEADVLGYPTSLWNLTDCITNSEIVKSLHGGIDLGLESENEETSGEEEAKDTSPSHELVEEFQLALGRLQDGVGSLEKDISSWDDAKSKLDTIFQFPSENAENEAISIGDDGARNKRNESRGSTHGDTIWDKRDRMHLQAPSPGGSAKKRKVFSRKNQKIHGRMTFSAYRNLLDQKTMEQKYLRSISDSATSGANAIRKIIQNFPKQFSNLFVDRQRGTGSDAETSQAEGLNINRKYDEVEVEDLEEKAYQDLLRKDEREEDNDTIQQKLDQLHRQKIEREERKIRAKELAEQERIQREIEERERQEELEKLAREAEAEKAAKNLLRELTEDEHRTVEDAMYGRGPATEKLAATDTDSVQRSSMQTLQPGAWLNDEVIHFFFNMLAKRDESLCASDTSGSRRRCHYFKSFFFTKLFDEGASNQYRYANVKRWSKRVPGKDIFALDKIFFACNVNQMHWTCAVIFMQQKRIQFYDSMRGDGYHYSQGLFKYLLDEWKAKKGGELPDKDQWKIVGNEESVPIQQNGFDCGVFTCMFADFLSLDRPLSFTQEHITQCRERIALSIMKGVAIE